MATKMVMAVMALVMAFYVCQFSAWTYDDEEAAIIAELEDSPLEDIDWEDIFDDSSEFSPRMGAKDILKTLEEKCKCEDLTCFCCGTPKIAGMSFDACVNMTMYPNEKIIGIGAGAAGNTVYRNISVGKLERVCDRLPGFLKKFKLCMFNTWTETDDTKAMSACSSIDIIYSNTTVATIQFHCLELKDGKAAFAIPENATGRSAIMSFKLKNPVKSLVSWLKKKITSKE